VIIIIALCYQKFRAMFLGGVEVGSGLFNSLVSLPMEEYRDVEWMADCMGSIKRVQNYIKARLGNEMIPNTQRKYADSSMLIGDAKGMHIMANWHHNYALGQLPFARNKVALIMEAINAEIKSMPASKLRRAKEGWMCSVNMWLFQYGMFFSKYGKEKDVERLRSYVLEILRYINHWLRESVDIGELTRTYVYNEMITPESVGLTSDQLEKFDLHRVEPKSFRSDPKLTHSYKDELGHIRYSVTKYTERVEGLGEKNAVKYYFIANADPEVPREIYDKVIYSFLKQ
jgi:hypothetical protein